MHHIDVFNAFSFAESAVISHLLYAAQCTFVAGLRVYAFNSWQKCMFLTTC